MIYGSFEWDTANGQYIRIPKGKNQRMLILKFESTTNSNFYYLTTAETKGDFQHTIDRDQREFFFPCDNLIGKTMFIVGHKLDEVVKTEKLGERQYRVTYTSGLQKILPFKSCFSRYTSRVESNRIKLDSISMNWGLCGLCFDIVNEGHHMQLLECQHVFDFNCLIDYGYYNPYNCLTQCFDCRKISY